MLSAVILRECGYPALRLTATTGTPGIRPARSSRTVASSPQVSSAYCG